MNAEGGRIRRFEEDPKRREDWEFVKKWEEGRKGRIGTRRGGEGCDRWEEGKEGEAGQGRVGRIRKMEIKRRIGISG